MGRNDVGSNADASEKRLTLAPLEAAGPIGAGAHTLETLEVARRYNAWIFDRVKGALGNRVLEIGCGSGTITQFLVDRDWVVGVDVVPEYVAAARARFEDRPNVTILLHDLSSPTSNFPAPFTGAGRVGALNSDDFPPPLRGRVGVGGLFDSALGVNVFEHIEDDVAVMKAVHDLLEPAGTLTLLVPAHPLLMSRFDRAIGHHRRYTKYDLRRKLEAAGFRVERLRRSNPIGAIGWLVNNRLLRRRQLGAVRIYDRMVPVLASIDNRVEPLFGLSLIAVGRKPALVSRLRTHPRV